MLIWADTIFWTDADKVKYMNWYETSNMLKQLCIWTDTRLTWSENKVRKLIVVKVLHTSLLKTTVVAFKVLPLGNYAPTPAPRPPFKTILELDLWNGLQRRRCITPDFINVIKMPSFEYFLYLREQKNSHWGLYRANRQGVPTVICLV
jgi:hypothetical protein